MDMDIQISTSNLCVGYHGRAVLKSLSVTLRKGDFWGIVGPNGAGKTTLVKTLAGIIQAVAGEVYRASGLTFGYVPQRSNLDDIFPLTAFDVVLMGRFPGAGIGRRLSRADHDLARDYMRKVAVDNVAHLPYRILSGGQKQRVLIARALAFEPDVLILDEPTSGMDLAGEAEVMQLVLDLHRESKRTILMITHHLNLIANNAQKLIIAHGGGDSHLETGTVQDLMTEETLKKIYQQNIRVHTLHGRVYISVHNQQETDMGNERQATP